MALFPRGIADGVLAIEMADRLVIQSMDGAPRTTLDRLAAEVWRLADGATPVGDIAVRLGVPAEEVWGVLDRLADAGLLEARLAPPVAAAGWLGHRGAAPMPGQSVPQAAEARPKLAAAGPEADSARAGEARQKSDLKPQEQNDKRSAAGKEEDKKSSLKPQEQNDKRSAAGREADEKRARAPQEQNDKRSAAGAESKRKLSATAPEERSKK